MDRQFNCLKCVKSFKLKWHLKSHEKICKSDENLFKCDLCEQTFKSAKTLKQHARNCKPNKIYVCDDDDDCIAQFDSYGKLAQHKSSNHDKVPCEICEKEIRYKNVKRHMKTVHEGATPAKATEWVAAQKKKQHLYKHSCDLCARKFCDKSTLNRHRKVHNIRCEKCTNVFQSEGSLREHVRCHRNEDIETKRQRVPPEVIDDALDVHKIVENLLLIMRNRGQAIIVEDIIEHVENVTKKNFSVEILQVIVSIDPQAYDLYKQGQSTHIQLVSEKKPITPLVLEERRTNFKNKIKELFDGKFIVVDLISFQISGGKKKYESAKDILKANIVIFSDEEEESSEDNCDEGESKNFFENLLKRVNKKAERKARRQEKFGRVDWQKGRLSQLARTVNSVYRSEKKNCLKFETLLSKISDGKNQREDLERLIEESNGWLENYRDWVKRKTLIAI